MSWTEKSILSDDGDVAEGSGDELLNLKTFRGIPSLSLLSKFLNYLKERKENNNCQLDDQSMMNSAISF